MKITIEICLPMPIDLDIELEEDGEDFDIKHTTLNMMASVTKSEIYDHMTDEDHEYILQKALKMQRGEKT